MSIREPYAAGTFYPVDPTELKDYCKSLLAPSSLLLSARAIILPHAGYAYSGPTACRVLSKIKVPEKIFLIGPNHSATGAPFALAVSGEWETPLGRVPVASELAASLLEMSHDFVNDEEAHRREHSLEVQLPFLQAKNPDIKIVPLIVGVLDLDAASAVARVCGEYLACRKEPVLVVISTDMSHYENDQVTRKKDRYALEAIQNLDEEAFVSAVEKYNITMCGFVPVYMLLVMKNDLRIQKATLVDYRTSGDATGDFESVVGYAGFIFE